MPRDHFLKLIVSVEFLKNRWFAYIFEISIIFVIFNSVFNSVFIPRSQDRLWFERMFFILKTLLQSIPFNSKSARLLTFGGRLRFIECTQIVCQILAFGAKSVKHNVYLTNGNSFVQRFTVVTFSWKMWNFGLSLSVYTKMIKNGLFFSRLHW